MWHAAGGAPGQHPKHPHPGLPEAPTHTMCMDLAWSTQFVR